RMLRSQRARPPVQDLELVGQRRGTPAADGSRSPRYVHWCHCRGLPSRKSIVTAAVVHAAEPDADQKYAEYPGKGSGADAPNDCKGSVHRPLELLESILKLVLVALDGFANHLRFVGIVLHGNPHSVASGGPGGAAGTDSGRCIRCVPTNTNPI